MGWANELESGCFPNSAPYPRANVGDYIGPTGLPGFFSLLPPPRIIEHLIKEQRCSLYLGSSSGEMIWKLDARNR